MDPQWNECKAQNLANVILLLGHYLQIDVDAYNP